MNKPLSIAGISFVLLLMCLFIPPKGFGQQKDVPLLKVGVTETKYLPPDMYGTWSIAAKVIQSTVPPELYSPAGQELWTLGEADGMVFIKNIVNQATATVTVDQVNGNTATFHHLAQIPSRQMKIMEIPTVTVDGDKLYGYNDQTVVFYRHGKEVAAYNLKIEVEGTRLSGAQVTFGQPKEPDIEIAPLQHGD